MWSVSTLLIIGLLFGLALWLADKIGKQFKKMVKQ
jgi:hypothetical protein